MKNSTFTLLLLFLVLNLGKSQSDCTKWWFGAAYNNGAPISEFSNVGLNTNHSAVFDFYYNGIRPDSKINFLPGLRLRGGVTEAIETETSLLVPSEAAGTNALYNAQGDLALLLKFNLQAHERINLYADLIKGLRVSTAQEVTSLNDDFPDFNDFDSSSEQLTSTYARFNGFAIGALIGITPQIFLDLKTGFDWTKTMAYADLDQYPDDIVLNEVSDVFHRNISVGLIIKINCKSDRAHNEKDDPSFQPDRIPVQKKKDSPIKN